MLEEEQLAELNLQELTNSMLDVFPQIHYSAAAVQPNREGGARLRGTAGCDALRLQRPWDFQHWHHAFSPAASHNWPDAQGTYAPTCEKPPCFVCETCLCSK